MNSDILCTLELAALAVAGEIASPMLDRWPAMRSSYLDLPGKGGQWVVTQSAFAEIASVDVHRALQEIRNFWAGGLGLDMGQGAPEFLTLRHGAPIADLNAEEFMRPLIVLCNFADMLERKFSQGDT